MKYSRSDLMNCSSQLFKLIVKTHNRYKHQGKGGLSYREIDSLIKEYCENNYNSEDYH